MGVGVEAEEGGEGVATGVRGFMLSSVVFTAE